MAGAIGQTIFSGTFNALAFTGFSFLFRTLDKNKYLKETKRHNEAMEKLTRARDKWSRNETMHRDRIQELQRQISEANSDIALTNKAFEYFKKIRSITFENRRWNREPHLDDF